MLGPEKTARIAATNHGPHKTPHDITGVLLLLLLLVPLPLPLLLLLLLLLCAAAAPPPPPATPLPPPPPTTATATATTTTLGKQRGVKLKESMAKPASLPDTGSWAEGAVRARSRGFFSWLRAHSRLKVSERWGGKLGRGRLRTTPNSCGARCESRRLGGSTWCATSC